MKKKMLSLLLVFTMLCAFVPVVATAATSGTCGDNATWTLDDEGTLTISGIGDMEDYRSPDEVPWYDYKDDITAVIISDGVTNIAGSSFHNCTKITSVSMPDGITEIGGCAFMACQSLTSVVIPNGVEYINVLAFMLCTNLTNLFIPKSLTLIDQDAFRYCNLTDVYYEGNEGEWSNINSTGDLTSATIHYNSSSLDMPPAPTIAPTPTPTPSPTPTHLLQAARVAIM